MTASSSNYRRRMFPTSARALAVAMAAVAAVQGSNIQPAHASSVDITDSGAPTLGSTPAAPTTIASGDASVASQTGAFSYGYTIVVPPGRQGAAPHLSLSYSSQGAIYGTFATSWTLSIPDVHEDTSQGRLATHNSMVESTQADPKADDRFTSSMAGGRPFVKVADISDTDVYGTYRARNDASYTRYQRMNPTAAFRWRALTLDGGTYEFGGSTASACASVVSEGYAPLTRSLDQWGNSVTYNWAWDAALGECHIDTITYGANAGAAVADFAKVSFTYGGASSCPGTTVAIGSQVDWRSGKKIVTGASAVEHITVESKPGGLATATVHKREIFFGYSFEGYQPPLYAGGPSVCNGSNTPFRALATIQEVVTATGLASVTTPMTTFEYGTAVINRNTSFSSVQSLGEGPHVNGHRVGVTKMLTDMDGNGVPELVSSTTNTPDANNHITKCQASWYDNSGSHILDLPILPWGTSFGAWPENCTLNYQRSTLGNFTYHTDNYLSYRWMDLNNDGRVDIVGTLDTVRRDDRQNDGTFFVDYLTDAEMPLGLPPPTRVGATAVCTTSAPPPALCASIVTSFCSVSPTTSCAVGSVCSMNLGTMSSCSWGNHPCGVDESEIPLPVGGTVIWEDSVNERNHPFHRCGQYPWFLYANTADVNGSTTFATTSDIRWQPIALDSEGVDDTLGATNAGSRKAAMDIDGDGLLDGLNLGYNWGGTGPTPWWWNTFRNTGNGTLSQTDYLFRAPDGAHINESNFIGNGQASTNEAVKDVITTASLVDINGDGLPDYVTRRIPAGGTGYSAPVNVAWNDGTQMRMKKYSDGLRGETDLSQPTVLSVGRQRTVGTWIPYNNPPIGKPTFGGYFSDGKKYTMERMLDVDGDGRVDIVSMGNSETNVPTVAYNLGGEFKAPVPLLGSVLGAPQVVTITASVSNGRWETTNDFIDGDGDGLVDYYAKNALGTIIGYRHNYGTKPPRLLHTIRNGYGATTTVAYGMAFGVGSRTLPKPQRVVTSITTTDDFTQTGSAQVASTTSSYKYTGPR
jgi:hypothetical protein